MCGQTKSQRVRRPNDSLRRKHAFTACSCAARKTPAQRPLSLSSLRAFTPAQPPAHELVGACGEGETKLLATMLASKQHDGHTTQQGMGRFAHEAGAWPFLEQAAQQRQAPCAHALQKKSSDCCLPQTHGAAPKVCSVCKERATQPLPQSIALRPNDGIRRAPTSRCCIACAPPQPAACCSPPPPRPPNKHGRMRAHTRTIHSHTHITI